MDYKLLDDTILVKLLKTSDENAFREIYQRYWLMLYTNAFKKVNSKVVAEELIQNIFVSLWEKRETSQIEHLPGYLNTSVKYQVLNYIKSCIIKERYANSVRGQNENAQDDADSRLVMNQLSEAIQNAISQLPEKSQQIFRLSRFENCSIKEIARAMNISEKVVEYHITKSLKIMRCHLKEFIVVELIIINISLLY
jgi:RNA polymerase sigma-70 factor (ECF subfamily)